MVEISVDYLMVLIGAIFIVSIAFLLTLNAWLTLKKKQQKNSFDEQQTGAVQVNDRDDLNQISWKAGFTELSWYVPGLAESKPLKNTNKEDVKFVRALLLRLQEWLPPEMDNQAAMPPVEVVPVSPKVEAINTPPIYTVSPLATKKETPLIESLARQVDVVLQDMLKEAGYRGPALRLDENEDGDLVVWVGSQSFIGLDHVPDERVTAIIKRAAQRWTDRHLAT